MQKIDLLQTPKDWGIIMGCIALVAMLSLSYNYYQFQNLKAHKFQRLVGAKVLNHYTKSSKDILKLAHQGYQFYTRTKPLAQNLTGRTIDLTIITDRLGFLDFLMWPFFVNAIHLYPTAPKLYDKTLDWIKSQHQDPSLKAFFGAIFLANSMGKDDRQIVTTLGIAHLVAISGYHIGLLAFMLYAILTPLYAHLQKRYFPYRNRHHDLGAIVFVALLCYASFVGMPISLLRSMSMFALGLLFAYSHIRILSFYALLVAVLLLLAFDVGLAGSMAFWLSVSGVFYIYVFLHHSAYETTTTMQKLGGFCLLNIWLFVAMNPIVHTIFAQTSPWQLLSPALSIVFNVFYPVQMVLHGIGLGGWLDPWLITMIDALPKTTHERLVPVGITLSYVVLSIVAIHSHRTYALLIVYTLGINVWIYSGEVLH